MCIAVLIKYVITNQILFGLFKDRTQNKRAHDVQRLDHGRLSAAGRQAELLPCHHIERGIT